MIDVMVHSGDRREIDGKLTYQYRKLATAMTYVPEDRRRVALDIGAHVGLWSMHLVKLFSHVHAFEPNPIVARLFPLNVPVDHVTLHQCALGKNSGFAGIHYFPTSTGNTYLTEGKEVTVERLDDFGFEEVDFIKIDTEGFEEMVVKGGRETIRKNRPIIVIEQKGNDVRRGRKRNGGTTLLKQMGMKSVFVIGGDHVMIWKD